MRSAKYGARPTFELHLDLEAVRARGAGNAPAQPRMHGEDGIDRTLDGLQLGLQPRIAAGVELRHPGVGERAAGVRLDARGLAAHRLADEDPHALFGLMAQPLR